MLVRPDFEPTSSCTGVRCSSGRAINPRPPARVSGVGPSGLRTHDLPHESPLLYQLSLPVSGSSKNPVQPIKSECTFPPNHRVQSHTKRLKLFPGQVHCLSNRHFLVQPNFVNLLYVLQSNLPAYATDNDQYQIDLYLTQLIDKYLSNTSDLSPDTPEVSSRETLSRYSSGCGGVLNVGKRTPSNPMESICHHQSTSLFFACQFARDLVSF